MSDLEGMINGILSDPDQMKKIMDMAGQIMGTDGGNSTPETGTVNDQAMPSSNIFSDDPNGLSSVIQNLMGDQSIQKIISKVNALNTKNDKQGLLDALKPWLSESRRRKLDRAMMFAKVMNIAGATALFKRGGLK